MEDNPIDKNRRRLKKKKMETIKKNFNFNSLSLKMIYDKM